MDILSREEWLSRRSDFYNISDPAVLMKGFRMDYLKPTLTTEDGTGALEGLCVVTEEHSDPYAITIEFFNEMMGY